MVGLLWLLKEQQEKILLHIIINMLLFLSGI